MKKFGWTVCVQCPTFKYLPHKMADWPNTTHYIDPYDTNTNKKKTTTNKPTKHTNILSQTPRSLQYQSAMDLRLHKINSEIMKTTNQQKHITHAENIWAGSSDFCLKSNNFSWPNEFTVKISDCFRNVTALIVQLSAFSERKCKRQTGSYLLYPSKTFSRKKS